MPIANPKISVCMTIRKSTHRMMSEVAKAEDRSVSWIANTAIEEWLTRAGHQLSSTPDEGEAVSSNNDGILQIED